MGDIRRFYFLEVRSWLGHQQTHFPTKSTDFCTVWDGGLKVQPAMRRNMLTDSKSTWVGRSHTAAVGVDVVGGGLADIYDCFPLWEWDECHSPPCFSMLRVVSFCCCEAVSQLLAAALQSFHCTVIRTAPEIERNSSAQMHSGELMSLWLSL